MLARTNSARRAGLPAGLLFLVTGLIAGLASLLVTGLAPGAAQAQGYTVGPGDTLQIEVLEDPSLNRSTLVLPDGTIAFPFVGTLKAGGMSLGELRRTLAAGLAPNFASEPTVAVSVAALAERPAPAAALPYTAPVIDVFIMGEVAQAGRREVSPGTTILQFLAEAGGLTPFAADTRIQLHRTDPASGSTRVYLFSLGGKGNGPRISPATQLAPGDVVVVPSRHLFE
ncbi:polysaccharide biosynthesis/export family protein [Pseudoruegeria sp. HB172150]|uniref:polysaccharide biosynthesis/export family protein n=1 Tax=Pseudoruegeria sp. HB172150 TaxID=2721164 RepID=UPI001557FF13|nr:polysaccharide biosynthesis/export family protein [Pseudoruegeria sp. HB172150]